MLHIIISNKKSQDAHAKQIVQKVIKTTYLPDLPAVSEAVQPINCYECGSRFWTTGGEICRDCQALNKKVREAELRQKQATAADLNGQKEE